ncbi:hypothetical protein GCM10025875_37870 [Litorihabitans aurantiacus]|uniref:M23ase beta-sheet core domain-containing protein n=1 Tax=Litorihabitans aurantiacus TaxID=1930061 RepID=A0AA38CV00_9MICO|nr:hypothetical protein GCM10025875_36540 [Litorihabitans aurantiacus]GMA33731.1 hypothetical protein GCM10025875_37230 [Litorihabitans aurantiacus]GMA33795.1 hypothetical protein GCM10025875_37870 [Litorihabitans aurantiacus]
MLVGGVAAFLMLGSPSDTDVAGGSCEAPVVLIDGAELPESIGSFSAVQVRNAAVIVSLAAERDLPPSAAAIGIMTAITESGLRNLANEGKFVRPANSRVMSAAEWDRWRAVAMLSLNYPNDGAAPGDWDSVGLFQGRPQAGWGGQGTDEEIVQNLLNPAYTTGRFLDELVTVEGWETMPAWKAAQTVQVSKFPMAYDAHWEDAQQLTQALTGTEVTFEGCTGDPGAASTYPGLVADSGWAAPITGARFTGGFGDVRNGYTHMGSDFAAPLGTPIYAAADGLVTHTSCKGFQGRSPCNVMIDHGTDADGARIQTLYVHMYPGQTHVDIGQTVTAGQHIADVGNNGRSTGPHLHYEVWVNGQAVNALPYMRSQGITLP